jgi:hypothetical protein
MTRQSDISPVRPGSGSLCRVINLRDQAGILMMNIPHRLAQAFAWHPVSQAVGNIHHQDASLIAEIDDPAE